MACLLGILYAFSENVVYTMSFARLRRVSTVFSLILGILSAFPAQAATFVIPDATHPYWKRQWYMRQIQAPEAWLALPTQQKEVVVAVIDAGVDITHPDLQAAIWTNPGEIPDNKLDDDQNGFVDDVHGWNFVTNSGDVRPQEIKDQLEEAWSHGTFVASLIGARAADHVGMVGVNQGAKIMPIVALDGDGFGTIPNVLKAIRYAVNHGATIINLSLAGFDESEELAEMIQRAHDAGVLVVAATGNGTIQAGRDTDRQPIFPACSNGQKTIVVGVSGTDALDQHAPYANYGSRCTDISAPGYDLFGARPSYMRQDEPEHKAERYLEGMTGTSLAAPLVSGVASLLKSVRPDLTVDQLYALVVDNADNIEDSLKFYERGKMGSGRLNALKSLRAALAFGRVSAATTTSPVPTINQAASVVPTSTEQTPGATSFFYRTPSTTLRWLLAPKPIWSTWVVRDRQPQVYAVTKEGMTYRLKRWNPVTNKEMVNTFVLNVKLKKYVYTDAKTKQTWEVDKTGKVTQK